MGESKYIELARKLKALADGGVGGEKVNAKRALDALLKKLMLSEKDIELEQLIEFEYKARTDYERRLLHQIAASVLGKSVRIYSYARSKVKYYIKAPTAPAIEIQMKYDFYSRLYYDELKIFFRAFIQKHSLFPPDGVRSRIGEMSIEEQQEAMRVLSMQETLKTERYRDTKRLHSGD